MHYLTIPFLFSMITSVLSFAMLIIPDCSFLMYLDDCNFMKKLVECMEHYMPFMMPFSIFDLLVWMCKMNVKTNEMNRGYQKEGTWKSRWLLLSQYIEQMSEMPFFMGLK